MPSHRPPHPTTAESRVYSLAEVADITGLSLRLIQKDCSRKRVTHIKHGRRRGMTAIHINEMLTNYTVSGQWYSELSDLDRVREASKKNARRATRRIA